MDHARLLKVEPVATSSRRPLPPAPALTAWEMGPFLLAGGWIRREELAWLRISDASRRNRAYRVERPDGTGFVLKQGYDADGARTVAHEAAVYRRIAAPAAPPALTRRVPRFLGYVARPGVLVLDLLPGTGSADGLGLLAPDPAEALGQALAALHSIPPDLGSPARPRALDARLPDLDMVRRSSAGGLEVLRRVQASTEWGTIVDAAGRDWSPAALIHHDMRLENVLLPVDRGGASAVAIVDWEMAGPGDPRWDVGCTIAAILGLWLEGIPDIDGPGLDRLAPHGAIPLPVVRTAIAAFLDGYGRAAGIDPRRSEGWDGVLRCAAVRLLQIAFEAAQGGWRLPPMSGHALDLGAELGARPRVAEARWLEPVA